MANSVVLDQTSEMANSVDLDQTVPDNDNVDLHLDQTAEIGK